MQELHSASQSENIALLMNAYFAPLLRAEFARVN